MAWRSMSGLDSTEFSSGFASTTDRTAGLAMIIDRISCTVQRRKGTAAVVSQR